MKKITPFDWERMLFGEAPPIFLIEVFVRGLLLYLLMLFIMRLLGKRMAGELSVTETVLMVTLGGSIAVAMQVPDAGILLGVVVLTCAFMFENGVSLLTTKSKRFEQLSQGRGAILVKDGVLQTTEMKRLQLTQQQVFAHLRNEKIHQLGEVERLYLEAAGDFNIYKKKDHVPAGLPLFPLEDQAFPDMQDKSKHKACVTCGYTTEHRQEHFCKACNGNKWVDAIS